MEARQYIGIVLVIIGTTLIPIGWMFSTITAVVGWVAFVLGLAIFITQRYIEKTEEAEFGSGRGGSGIPTDVHDHSGWGSGGRSESWKSSTDYDGGGDGGD
ncbi:hypothetical protein ACFL3A_02315 [Pseudomonadota bacterium]